MERTRSAQKRLIFLCWLLYAAAYAGRYSYASNVNLIMAQYGVTRADAGLVTSAFFFTYGIGQIIHGFLCRFYHRRFVLPAAMLWAPATPAACPVPMQLACTRREASARRSVEMHRPATSRLG